MNITSVEMLRRLGSGESIADVCAAAGIGRDEFNAWWQAETRRRLPPVEGELPLSPYGRSEIVRDRWGIPHILADNNEALFFAFGYAMAQDRLFQLDYLRRRAWGRLCEVLGPEALELDLTARTIGLAGIAEAEWEAASPEARMLITAFSDGVNAVIAASASAPPIEFDLLDYRPEPWSPVDCLAIEGEFRWYLTGRMPVLAVPEMVRRTLGDGPLYRAFLQGEADDESILPAGSYPKSQCGMQPLMPTGGDPSPCQGSNNWVVAGQRTTTGKPLLASDPHIAFGAVSCWYEVHLCGGSFNVAGMAYAGIPAVMFGRNERVAWGCTNNICAQRDLYLERTDAAHPDAFFYDGRWEPARRRDETIRVKGREAVHKSIRSSRHGPIVDELLPPVLRSDGPISIRWLGREPCRWLEAMLSMDRAKNAAELREATRSWIVPTFSVVYCDVEGRIGFQSVGRIPIRKQPTRACRPGWEAEHEWQGVIPFEAMPHVVDPQRGFMVTANNRPAPDDFAYPLAGVWTSAYRARRIRQMIESEPKLSFDDLGTMQLDVLSLRAVRCLPRLLDLLASEQSPAVRTALQLLRAWNCRMDADSAAAAIFDVFFVHWSQAVASERFSGEAATWVAAAAGGLAVELLDGDAVGWFAEGRRQTVIRNAFAAALDTLSTRLGPSPADWQWGKLHRMQVRHLLSGRGDLAVLLDQPSLPVHGDMLTVCNTGSDAEWQGTLGAGYRMLADMSVSPAELWAVDAGSESGHPASPHYGDQLNEWLAGRYHRLPLDRAETIAAAEHRMVLMNQGG